MRPARRPALVATDLDGTVVRSDGTIGPRTRRALAAVEDAGIPLVVVTGRPSWWMRPVVEETGHRGVAVCANGALIVDLHTETVLASHVIDPAVAMEVVARLRRAIPGVTFAVERTGGPSGFLKEDAYQVRWVQPNVRVVAAAELVAEPMVKLLARHSVLDSDELLAQAAGAVGDLVSLTHSSSDGLLEMAAHGVSKASGLRHMAAGLGVSADAVIAFGDMPNDVPMLLWAGWSVAVSNAHPAARAVADEVTASNDEDGVALVLERYLTPVGDGPFS